MPEMHGSMPDFGDFILFQPRCGRDPPTQRVPERIHRRNGTIGHPGVSPGRVREKPANHASRDRQDKCGPGHDPVGGQDSLPVDADTESMAEMRPNRSADRGVVPVFRLLSGQAEGNPDGRPALLPVEPQLSDRPV